METGRVINRRYLLKRLIKQGQVSTIYQGVDQILQRVVAVKSVSAAYSSTYRAAIRLTAQFSHPNIIGLYDVIVEPENLYVVQEYVEGSDFATLLQTQFTPFEVANFGCQICHALIYAGSSSRKVCHGDLTPAAIMRDRQGLVRINNFALPSDLDYFTAWSTVGGGESIVVSDRELPWGQQSDGRRADDSRSVGLLLYQLLTVRPQGTTIIEPNPDGRLHFPRTIPVDLCQIIARAVVRHHPEFITSVEALYAELKAFSDAVEPPVPVMVSSSYQREIPPPPGQLSPANCVGCVWGGVSALPMRESGQPGTSLSAYSAKMPALEPMASAPTTADVSLKLATARQAAYSELEEASQTRRSPILMLLLIGLVVFLLFFIVGYFTGHLLIP